MSTIDRIMAAATQVMNPEFTTYLDEGKQLYRNQLLDAFSYGNWSQLDHDQKKTCCEALSNLYCDDFGIPRIPVSADRKAPGNYGGYSPSKNSISLNENLFKNGTTYDAPRRLPGEVDDSNWQLFDTTVHETRHAFQKWAVDHPQEYLDRCENKEEALENLRGWALNEGKYWGNSNDPEYLTQPQEMDTWNYAHKETTEAFAKIEEKNGKEPEEVKESYDDFWQKNDPNKQMERNLDYDPDFNEKMEKEMENECDRKGIRHDFSDLTEEKQNESNETDEDKPGEVPKEENTMDDLTDENEFDEDDSNKPKVLKRDEEDLRNESSKNIDNILEERKLDLQDKGWNEEDIDKQLAQEREELENDFEQTAFHYGEDNDNSSDQESKNSEEDIESLNPGQENNGVTETMDDSEDLNKSAAEENAADQTDDYNLTRDGSEDIESLESENDANMTESENQIENLDPAEDMENSAGVETDSYPNAVSNEDLNSIEETESNDAVQNEGLESETESEDLNDTVDNSAQSDISDNSQKSGESSSEENSDDNDDEYTQ